MTTSSPAMEHSSASYDTVCPDRTYVPAIILLYRARVVTFKRSPGRGFAGRAVKNGHEGVGTCITDMDHTVL